MNKKEWMAQTAEMTLYTNRQWTIVDEMVMESELPGMDKSLKSRSWQYNVHIWLNNIPLEMLATHSKDSGTHSILYTKTRG